MPVDTKLIKNNFNNPKTTFPIRIRIMNELIEYDKRLVNLLPFIQFNDNPSDSVKNELNLLDIKIPEPDRVKKQFTSMQKAANYIKSALTFEWQKFNNKSSLMTYTDIEANERRVKQLASEQIIIAETKANEILDRSVAKLINKYVTKFKPTSDKMNTKSEVSWGLSARTSKYNPLSQGSNIWGTVPGLSAELVHKKITTKENIEIPNGTIKFYIQDLRSKNIVVFPITITDLTDAYTPSWTRDDFLGRSEGISHYTSTDRTWTINFDLIAESINDLQYMYYKLQWLSQTVYPKYDNNSSAIMDFPVIRIRIGDILKGTNGEGLGGYFTSLTNNFKVEDGWETMLDGMMVPRHISVQSQFTVIHDTMPDYDFKYYNIESYPKDTDRWHHTPRTPSIKNVLFNDLTPEKVAEIEEQNKISKSSNRVEDISLTSKLKELL